jgi:HK97 family phage major capsid protein
VTAEELRRLNDDYNKAWASARDESLPQETRDTAATDAMGLRKQIDAALIDNEQAREDEQRAAAIEARVRTANIIASVRPAAPKSDLPMDEIRAYAEKKTNQVSFKIAQPQATDMTTVDTTSYIGVYTDPQSWYNRVRMFQIAQSGVLAAGPTILNTANGQQINIPKQVTDATAVAGAEGTAATVTGPVVGTAPLNQYRLDGQMAISDELFRDSGIDLNAYLGDCAARALAIKFAPYLGDIDIGTGVGLIPAAITVGTTLGVTAVSQTTPTLDEVKALKYSVLPAYRPNGKWIGNSTITLAMALAKDQNDNYMWQPSVSASEPDRLFGHPFYEDAYFDASTTGNIPIVFGDVAAAYIVRYVGGMEVSFSRDFAFTSFETTMRFAIWVDAATVDTIAVKHLILA